MAGSFLDDDLAVFFDTDDFAVTATWNTESIPGQFFNESYEWDGVESVIDRFEAPAVHLSGIRQGDLVVIDGKSYEVRSFKILNSIMVVRFQ